MGQGSVKKNLSYQTIYQILNTCLPLITSPYLARVLGAEKQGVFSFTQSIVNYFTLVAMLGVTNYGIRRIAECQEDKDARSQNFWNIYALQFCVSLTTLVIYIVYIVAFCKENVPIACIQGIYILGAVIDINWLFFGIEKFKTTVTRSIFIRIASVVLILLLVKSPKDLWIYTLIMSGSTFASNFVLWFFACRVINFDEISVIRWMKVREHIKPNLVLFVPLLAMSVYHIMDKTMLGLLSSYAQVGFYYNADKIINIPIGIINGVGLVMFPRTTALIEAENEEEANKLFFLSLEVVFVVSVAMACGIASISKEFTPFFFGEGFEECINLTIVLSPVLILKAISQTCRMQYLIPKHMENIFIQSVFLGAGVNLVVNLALISNLGAMGAVIGTLAAELVTCIWQYMNMNKSIISFKSLLKSIIYVVIGIIMFAAVRATASVLTGGLLSLVVEILVGAFVFGALCMLYWKITRNSILYFF